MKNIIIILFLLALTSCHYLLGDEDSVPVSFSFVNLDNTKVFRVRVIALKDSAGLLIPMDSVSVAANDIDSNWETIDPSHKFSLAFSQDQLVNINSGVFQAVVIKDDQTQFREKFGKISGHSTEIKRYVIQMENNGIKVN